MSDSNMIELPPVGENMIVQVGPEQLMKEVSLHNVAPLNWLVDIIEEEYDCLVNKLDVSNMVFHIGNLSYRLTDEDYDKLVNRNSSYNVSLEYIENENN